MLLAASCLVASLVAELGLRAFGHRSFTVHSDRANFWAYHPTFGWHHRPDQQGPFELGEVRVEVRINRRGLRDRDYAFERASGQKRILAIGDSFVWGFGVDQDEVFTERMESVLGDVEVINAGVSGYSTDQELLWLRDEGMRYRPDLVLLVVSGNDDAMNHRRVAYFVYPKPIFVLAQDSELELANVPVPRASLPRRLAYIGSRYSVLVNLAVGRVAGVLRSSRASSSRAAVPDGGVGEPFALTSALIDEIRDVAAAGDAELLIVTTEMFWHPGSTGTYAELVAALKRRGHEVLDVESAEGFAGENMRLSGDGHWNRDGHAFVARRVIEHIERRGLLGQGSRNP